MRTMALSEAQSHLSTVIDQVPAGEEIVITRRGYPVARIVADYYGPAHDPATLVKELQAFVFAQPLAEDSSVVAMREMDHY